MIETIAISALLAAATQKILDSVAARASAHASDALLSRLKGDQTKKAFARALGQAVQRYTESGRIHLAGPLVQKHGLLADHEVAEELSRTIDSPEGPNVARIGERWQRALPRASEKVDFVSEAALLVSYLDQALRANDVFRPAFQLKTLEAIAEGNIATNESLTKIERSLEGLRELLGTSFEKMTGVFLESPTLIHSQIADFTTLIEEKTRGFVGRQFVFDAFDDFRAKSRSGYFFVLGDPGIGKSAIAAQLVKTRGYIHHFNVRAQSINTADAFLQNVCAQLIATYELPHDRATIEDRTNSGILDKLLREVQAKHRGQNTVLVVDGLDEVDDVAPGVNQLNLPKTLPDGIFMFVTTRRKSKLPSVDLFHLFSIEHDSASNTNDVHAYVKATLGHAGIRRYISSQNLEDDSFVKLMIGKSEGNFMYLRYVIPELESGAYRDRALTLLPIGLKNYYEDHWERMRSADKEAWFQYKLSVLMALTRVKKPVSIILIAKFSGVQDTPRIRGVLRDWEQFLHTEVATCDGVLENHYRIYHESFLDFIRELDEVKDSALEREDISEGVNIAKADERIVEALWGDLFGDVRSAT